MIAFNDFADDIEFYKLFLGLTESSLKQLILVI